MAIPKLNESELKLLADFIHSYCGLTFEGSQKILFKKRVQKRLEETGFTSVKDYYNFIRYSKEGEEELKKLIDMLTVNETYFFREMPQLEVFRDEILKELAEKKKILKRIKVWSAACSNGAEPYSLAIMALESKALQENKDIKVEIVGSDISLEMLKEARRGVYTETYFRSTDKYYLEKYFEKLNGEYKVKDEVKRMCTFLYINLMNERQVLTMKNVDVVFLRNVLIYFDLEGKKKVVETIYKTMNPGGYLFIGQTESLFKVTNLYELKPFKRVLAYKKPED